ncbi:YhhN-like protein [Serratia rubidaea]|uniref:YhhN-like protein n=1 Tax=Serratia rubidaea TaxID=61652 RepID=A0A4U9H8D0_SERRU|nr:lysoplasmalogenase [Serratia rubidaea]QPR65176.1 lysoplasmalogenase [Serratia rubidaea]CAI0969917.1 YhhN-like protein [Serratia rubidaea]CAI1776892.1 YhhN-like protein [Serratia rubidaea]VTP59822.1 YhhN-like protein [Serratia rubidaea]HAY0639275.1 lysoplasmalogenase [Serratia rubidaea]
MSWPFLAVFFSGWLYVDAAYRGPSWQRWLFKPITLLLLLLLAWQAPVLGAAGYLIVFGLLATLAGDALLQLPRQQMLYALGAFFLAHLLYALSFASQMTFSLFWPLPLALLIIGVLLLATLWTRISEQRWAVVAYVGMTLLMVWLAGEQYFLRSTDYGFSLLAGTSLLLLASIVWLVSHYRSRFRAADAIVAFCYFAGHFLIVRSLYL